MGNKTARLFNELSTGADLVVDAGANIGVFTLAAAKRARRVVAFEPDPESFALLRRSVDRNQFKNVVLHSSCLSNKPGQVKLFLSPTSNKGNNSIVQESWLSNIFSADGKLSDHRAIQENCRSISVPATTLDSVFPSETIDLLKIDVEGAEKMVLEGSINLLREGRIRNIIMEWNPDAWKGGMEILSDFSIMDIEAGRKIKTPRNEQCNLLLSYMKRR